MPVSDDVWPFTRILVNLESWTGHTHAVSNICSCFQMAYRRDVGYYHQVSASLYFLSLPICFHLQGSTVPAVGFEWDSWKTSPMIDFNKPCCADESKGYTSTLEKHTLKKWDFLGQKMIASYSLIADFNCQIWKTGLYRIGLLWRALSQAQWVRGYWHSFVLCREDWKLFSLLLHHGCHKVIIKVISPPPCLLSFLLSGGSLHCYISG